MKDRIDFIVVGAQKSGTSALHAFLSAHPDISMPASKEMHFFNRTSNADFRLPIWSDRKRKLYHRKFPHFPDPSFVYGEATPHYMTWNVALDRIHDYNPEVRILALLRHPVDRAFSHWNMERQRGLVGASFDDAVLRELDSTKRVGERLDKVHSFLRRGFYVPQIHALWQRFGAERVLFVKHRDLLENHGDTLAQIHGFLGVAPHEEPARNVHSRTYENRMSAETRARLLNLYADDVKEVERTLGWDCDDWKS
jgi:hypothetical protein